MTTSVIVAGARTPIGRLMGSLKDFSGSDLGAVAIRAALEKLGQPVGVSDMHIAAHARSEGLVLVTNNMGEFARVPALEAENWVQKAQ